MAQQGFFSFVLRKERRSGPSIESQGTRRVCTQHRSSGTSEVGLSDGARCGRIYCFGFFIHLDIKMGTCKHLMRCTSMCMYVRDRSDSTMDVRDRSRYLVRCWLSSRVSLLSNKSQNHSGSSCNENRSNRISHLAPMRSVPVCHQTRCKTADDTTPSPPPDCIVSASFLGCQADKQSLSLSRSLVGAGKRDRLTQC